MPRPPSPLTRSERQQLHESGRDWVALTLAVGLATAVNLITVGVLLAAFYRGSRTGDYSLSENATQVLIAAFGGMIGVLGGYVGGRQVERAAKAQQANQAEREQLLLNAKPITEDIQRVEVVEPIEVVEADPD